jgi:hypothetical protein
LSLNAHDVSKLHRIIALAEKLIAKGLKQSRGKRPVKAKGKRVRRRGSELVRFRKMLKAQRKKGVPVAQLARKHGVSSAYIYMLR